MYALCAALFAAFAALTLSACTPDTDARISVSAVGCGGDGVLLAPQRAGILPPVRVPRYTYRVVTSWPHSPWSFTEGIVFHRGTILESSGLYGESHLTRSVPGSGLVLMKQPVAGKHFAEGITLFHGRLYQLTLSGTGLVYNPDTLQRTGTFSYEGPGWGLTHDDTCLIMSNGTNQLRFLDPETFRTVRTIGVTSDNVPVDSLNALAYVNGEIFANVWKTDYIARIDPRSGRLTGWIDLQGLLAPEERGGAVDVLNGIAYDEQGRRLVVTGKRWPKFFEITLRRSRGI
ncbi:MAG TPA: glutaminyl-peptide cyclotransferase [Geobacteraceae bacterium]|nr:glutaminyl-peptide cyclotransferase [Geobacteraceae bacterium]